MLKSNLEQVINVGKFVKKMVGMKILKNWEYTSFREIFVWKFRSLSKLNSRPSKTFFQIEPAIFIIHGFKCLIIYIYILNNYIIVHDSLLKKKGGGLKSKRKKKEKKKLKKSTIKPSKGENGWIQLDASERFLFSRYIQLHGFSFAGTMRFL